MLYPYRTRILSLASAALLVSVTVLASGCEAAEPAAPRPSTSVQAPASTVGSQEVLATVDGVDITLADLQAAIGDQLGLMDFQYQSQRHQVIEAAMRRHVRDQLLEAEAADRGVSLDALLAEVLSGQAAVSDDDVRFFYLQNQAQMQGRPFEAIAPQIRQFLENQVRETALEEFTDTIAEERDVTYLLEPFRVDINTAGAPSFGPDDAPITMVEFSDFECPYCESFVPTLERIKEAYAGQIRVVFLQFPLREIHPNAQKSAEASLCAFEQGKFWEAHDMYFAESSSLGVADLKEKATRLGLDADAFAACLDSGKYVDQVDAEMSAGTAVGVNGTPAVFINGRPLPGGAVPFEMVAEIIDDELERLGLR